MAHNNSVERAAVIGDVIASRHSQDREKLQQTMVSAMTMLNDTVPATQPLAMTVGDEFQGMYDDLGVALEASLQLRLHLMPTVDIRLGIGWGELSLVPSDPPFGQDGPCWWRARDAIAEVKRSESLNSVPNSRRTVCRTGTEGDALLNGYLGLRDHVLAGFDDIDARLCLMRLDGVSQVEMARRIGLSQSAVSRRFQSHGLFAVSELRPEMIVVPS